MSLNQLPVGAFDLILLAVLALGLFRGRKHGMSEELMNLIKWLTVTIVCAVTYMPIAQWLTTTAPFSLMASCMFAYTAVALAILALFALFKHQLGGKLIGSDVFGRSEYYLGMGAGVVRFSCILIALLALLNARYFSREEVLARERYQNDLYGSTYFPGWQTAQAVVFQNSLSGPWIKDHLSFLLIEPTKPEDRSLHQKDMQMPWEKK